MGSFAIPAWAVKTTELFKEYEPFSWVVAGFIGVAIVVLLTFLWRLGFWFLTKAQFTKLFIDKHPNVDPMKDTFENQRVFLNEFVLPTDPWIENKTFINCDIIGPANMFFVAGVSITETRGPNIDVVYLPATTKPTNGFGVSNSIFRKCAFHRITVFVGDADYQAAPYNTGRINWVSLTPGDIEQLPLNLNEPKEISDADVNK